MTKHMPIRSQPVRLLREPAAAEYCGLSVPTFRKLVEDGQLPDPHWIGGRKVYDVLQIDARLDAILYPDQEAADAGLSWD